VTALDAVPRIGAEELAALVSPADAVLAIRDALRAGLDPEAEQARTISEMAAGQLLLMPAEIGAYAGVKIAAVAPGNPAQGLPRIGAVYVLLDAATLLPVAFLDGTALTSLRTPAVSAVAVDLLLTRRDGVHAVVFGTGPQAWGHIEVLRTVRSLDRVTVVGRDPRRTADLVARCREAGLAAWAGTPADVADADVVCCCTTARTPLFDGALVADHAVVVAVGSHEPDARELDGDLVARAGAVVVESRAAALREAGDLLVPLHEGRFGPERVDGNLADLAAGRITLRGKGPHLFKSVGMAWQDLVVASAAHRRVTEDMSV
jgi:ornithine cyclodeaminase/alanine dehydrogenase-like protein (mu-crystallin family)